MQATGGSGTYIWSCDPEGVVGVGVNGTLEVLEQGVTMVFAADVRNTAHYNQSEVSKVFLFNFCNIRKYLYALFCYERNYCRASEMSETLSKGVQKQVFGVCIYM